jgi:hypothetical protein
MDASAAVRAACLMVWNTDHIGSAKYVCFLFVYVNISRLYVFPWCKYAAVHVYIRQTEHGDTSGLGMGSCGSPYNCVHN